MTLSQHRSPVLVQCFKRSVARLLDALVYVAIFENVYEVPCKIIRLLFRRKRSLRNGAQYRPISLYTTHSKSPDQQIYLSELIIGLLWRHPVIPSAFTPT
jgi:hypothetical protein